MHLIINLIRTEIIKLHRSSALRLIVILPLVFLGFDFFFYRYPLLSYKNATPSLYNFVIILPLKVVASAWVGLFLPLLLALLPALLVRYEHRAKMWKHIHAQPFSPKVSYGIKSAMLLAMTGLTCGLVILGLWFEGALLGRLHPVLAAPFLWGEMIRLMGWMLLGSLPLLGLYLWLSHRIDHGAVPVSMGLIGLVLSVALTRGEMNPPWQRDFIPWVLPYVCAQRSVERTEARQDVHMAGSRYKTITVEASMERMIRAGLTEEQMPWVFPPPTPIHALKWFSWLMWGAVTCLGLMERGRRTA